MLAQNEHNRSMLISLPVSSLQVYYDIDQSVPHQMFLKSSIFTIFNIPYEITGEIDHIGNMMRSIIILLNSTSTYLE